VVVAKTPPKSLRCPLARNSGQMNIWDWLWAWGRDDAVWTWVRTVFAALLGALIGGLFTLWGQSRQAKVQRDTLETQRVEDRKNSAHAQSLVAAHDLFEGFTDAHRQVQHAKPTIGDYATGADWSPHWNGIWTEDVSLDLDVKASLIADPDARAQVKRIVDLLDQAKNVARESHYPTALKIGLREIVGQLTAESIDVLGAYIRNEPHDSKRAAMFEALDTSVANYDKWEEHQIEASVYAMEVNAELSADAVLTHTEPP